MPKDMYIYIHVCIYIYVGCRPCWCCSPLRNTQQSRNVLFEVYDPEICMRAISALLVPPRVAHHSDARGRVFGADTKC